MASEPTAVNKVVPAGNSLSREVYKWLQSLDLSKPIRNVKWDFSNGYLAAEIFSWYFPSEIQLHNYNSGNSIDLKTRNWTTLKLFFKRQKLDIPDEIIKATMHCREDAAIVLVEHIFEVLTKRTVKKHKRYERITFSDENYQLSLPLHCRSTASKTIRNNVKLSETIENDNMIHRQVTAQKLIDKHIGHRVEQRAAHPNRFNIQRTIGEACIREPPTDKETLSVYPPDRTAATSPGTLPTTRSQTDMEQREGTSPARESSVHFKEIDVKQSRRNAPPVGAS